MAVARRRGIDTIRRAVTLQSKIELLGRELSDHETPMDEIEFDPRVDDDVLRLMFTACHPVLPVDARVALTLKMVAGLSTEEIARAFPVQTTTMAARITRAKKALSAGDVPFEVPVGEELANRLTSVLETVYLIFNEGYTATSGEHWARAELCEEAMRLGRMLAALAASESETHNRSGRRSQLADPAPQHTDDLSATDSIAAQAAVRWPAGEHRGSLRGRLIRQCGLEACARSRTPPRDAWTASPNPVLW